MATGEQFTLEQIAKWSAEGHWPPPKGITLLKETKPSTPVVRSLFDKLLQKDLTLQQKKVVLRALSNLR